MVIKKLLLILLFFILVSCEDLYLPVYVQPTYPGLYMGGGKWTLNDIGINLVSNSSGSSIIILENDTVCINSFREIGISNGYVIMRQDYNGTPPSRRFIKHKTQWEFSGSNLYVEWMNTPLGMKPTGELWVDYIHGYTYMEIMDYSGTYRTVYSFFPNGYGTLVNEFTLISPNFTVDLYGSGSEKSKVVTLQLVLVFQR
jgi:hypothetical protein